jgi:restriction system protein
MLPVLLVLEDGEEHRAPILRERIAAQFQLTPTDRAEMLPSRRQSVFDNRVGWAKTYLDKAGLVATVRRGVYKITDAGLALLAEKPESIDRDFLTRFPAFNAFLALQHAPENGAAAAPTPEGANDTSTPLEQLEAAYKKLVRNTEAEVLSAVVNATPEFFERLVVELLVAMGYGGSRADAGRALGRTGDGGVDGMISEDRLGFDVVYVQAKRWTDKAVQRPDVSGFAGSLLAKKARKGVFITTSRFSPGAHEYVREIEASAKIVLIDGPTLARHMVEFDIGVTAERTLTLKRLDSDYFTEE